MEFLIPLFLRILGVMICVFFVLPHATREVKIKDELITLRRAIFAGVVMFIFLGIGMVDLVVFSIFGVVDFVSISILLFFDSLFYFFITTLLVLIYNLKYKES